MIDFLESINLLKQVSRMGWIEGGIDPSVAEDVAQHTFMTGVISLIFSNSFEKEIDIEKAMEMAIVHDWAETIIGDFSVRVTSLIGGQEVKKDLEERALKELLNNLSDSEKYLEIWREYSVNKSVEARLVHAADRFSILLEANRLFRKGECSEKLREIWETVRDELDEYTSEFPFLEDLLKEVDEKYPFGD